MDTILETSLDCRRAQRPRRRLPPWFWIVLVPSLIAANRIAAWLAKRSHSPELASRVAPHSPLLPVSETLDFGQVWESRAFHWLIHVQNISQQALTFVSVEGRCTCIQASVNKQHLNPGETATIALLTDLSQIGARDPADIRPVQLGAQAEVEQPDGKRAMVSVVTRGLVRRYLHANPRRLRIGEQLVVGEPSPVFTWNIRPLVPIRNLEVKKVPAAWNAELLQERLARNPAYHLQISGTKSSLGPFVDEFELEATDARGNKLPIDRLRIEGRVRNPVSVLPETCELGPQPIGKAIRGLFSVVSRGPTHCIEGMEFQLQDKGLKALVLKSETGSGRISLETTVSSLGPETREATVQVRLRAGQTYQIPIRLHWYGITK
jgi:Protein of unknown function (DUF1573)